MKALLVYARYYKQADSSNESCYSTKYQVNVPIIRKCNVTFSSAKTPVKNKNFSRKSIVFDKELVLHTSCMSLHAPPGGAMQKNNVA